MNERALLFGPQAAQVGILHLPAAASASGQRAVIFINAGLIHHIGPNRLHVQLARALGACGVASLRIDLSGIGDSPPRADHLPIYELVRAEPREAMDALAAHGLQQFVLVGLCSGAYSAFHVACEDPRVVGAVMINPEPLALGEPAAESELSQAWARRYWTDSVFRPRAWLNLLSGRVNYRRIVDTLARQLKAPASPAATGARSALQSQLLGAVQSRPLCLLFLSSGQDVSRNYLDLLLDAPTLAAAPAGSLLRHLVPGSDHLFTRLEDQRRLLDFLTPWLAERAALPGDQGLST